MYDLEEMRARIKQIYHEESWRKRVDLMHRSQIIAIFIRYKACHFDPSLFKGKGKTQRHVITTPTHTIYTCYACGAHYIRDNPELTECELCGSRNILKETEQ